MAFRTVAAGSARLCPLSQLHPWHLALDGNPSITRLNEAHERIASQAVLETHESHASYEVARKVIFSAGTIRLFGRDFVIKRNYRHRGEKIWERF